MKRTLSFLAGFFLVAQPGVALAQTCTLSALSDFGALPLGAAYAKVPGNFVLANPCDRTQLNPRSVCDWMDQKTGIEYSGIEGKIFRKQITITAETVSKPLPFGIRATDRAEDVARKLRALKNAPALDVAAGRVASRGCLRTAAVRSFSLEVTFHADGALNTILVATPTE